MTAPDAPRGSKRGRPPAGRISPEALAAQRGGAVEGLVWLGRPPEAKASLLYRFLRLVARFVMFGLFRFHIRSTCPPVATSWSPRRTAAGSIHSW
jgi:hypothetical protein